MFCEIDGCGRPVEANGLCGTHNRQKRKGINKDVKPRSKINHFSSKKMKEITEYSKAKKSFFSIPANQICRVCNKPGSDSIHHSKGKVGYNDIEARLKGITLLLDQRFWIPIHSFNVNHEYGVSCHRYIEDHPEFARELGVTQSRLSK